MAAREVNHSPSWAQLTAFLPFLARSPPEVHSNIPSYLKFLTTVFS